MYDCLWLVVLIKIRDVVLMQIKSTKEERFNEELIYLNKLIENEKNI